MVDKKAEAVHKDSNIREEEYEKPEKYLVLRGRAGDFFFSPSSNICQPNKLCVGTSDETFWHYLYSKVKLWWLLLLHWRDVNNSRQTKEEVDRCATYLNLNMGLWTRGGPVSIINQSFSLMFVWAPHSLCPCVCVCVQVVVYYDMHVCVCEASFRYADDKENILALDCKTRWRCVHVCCVCGCVVVCCVFELALNMSQCCLPSGKTKTEMKGESKGNMTCRKALFAWHFLVLLVQCCTWDRSNHSGSSHLSSSLLERFLISGF